MKFTFHVMSISIISVFDKLIIRYNLKTFKNSVMGGIQSGSIRYLPIFGPRVYPRGSYVITNVRPSVHGPSVVRPSLYISETALRIFLIFCMKLGHYKGTKVTEPDF